MTAETAPPVRPQIAPQRTAYGVVEKPPRRAAAQATSAMITWIGANASHIIWPPVSAVAVTVPTVSRKIGSDSSLATRPSTTFSATQVGMRARSLGFIAGGKG